MYIFEVDGTCICIYLQPKYIVNIDIYICHLRISMSALLPPNSNQQWDLRLHHRHHRHIYNIIILNIIFARLGGIRIRVVNWNSNEIHTFIHLYTPFVCMCVRDNIVLHEISTCSCWAWIWESRLLSWLICDADAGVCRSSQIDFACQIPNTLIRYRSSKLEIYALKCMKFTSFEYSIFIQSNDLTNLNLIDHFNSNYYLYNAKW